MSLIFDGGKAGEGGGGKPIQYETMPSPIVGDIIQYVGETTANYTQGYFYKGIGEEGSATISQTAGNGITNLAVNVSTFYSEMNSITGSPITTGNYAFGYNGTTWSYGQSEVNMSSLGITFTEPQSSINVSVEPAEGESLMGAVVADQDKWDSMVTQSGTYIFTYEETVGDFSLDGETPADLYNTYGIDYQVGYTSPPETTVNQTVGILTIDVADPMQFAAMVGDAPGDYTFTFDGNDWSCEEIGGDTVTLSDYSIGITGTPISGDTFIVTLDIGVMGPVAGDQVIVDFTTGLESGDEITVSYVEGVGSWEQINVQPTPEIATQTTIGGNTQLSADEGVLVIETPDGTEEKQVANVEFVNNLVGDVASLLSEV